MPYFEALAPEADKPQMYDQQAKADLWTVILAQVVLQ